MAARSSPRLTVLSIDGVPYGLARRMMAEGVMPNLARLAEEAGVRPMRSVQPTVSSVAWASYMTGCNPGKHGIYGFIDRRAGAYEVTLPNSRDLAAEHLWEILSRAGRRVFGMNVPVTYPPRPVHGILIGCFLAPSLDKVAYPASVGEYLRSINYQIDSDAQLARQNKRAMLANLDLTLDRRLEAMFHFLEGEAWDFFHTHIMESDRLNHFLYAKMEDNDPEFAPGFFRFYRRVDEALGRLLERIGGAPVLVFSDHGFCRLRQEVQLSRYLVERGWTVPAEAAPHPLAIDAGRSRAYCLIPGRVFVNLRGREPGGIVAAEEYEQVREELKADLLALRDPETGGAVIRQVLRREEVYWPAGARGPQRARPEEVARATGPFGRAADLIAVPYDGYDLKLGLGGTAVFQRTALEGMHTYHDAFLVARGVELPTGDLEILMLARPMLRGLGVAAPADMDGEGAAVTPWSE